MAKIQATDQKLLGAFYTPPRLAEFLVEWAVRAPADRVLEPAAGEAVFLLSAARRLSQLGAPAELVERNLFGYDIDPSAAAAAAMVLAESFDLKPTIQVSDFFDVPVPEPAGRFDSTVGNPPWVRYHHFEGSAREQAQRIAEEAGVSLSGLASSWAAFVVHAASCLKPSGRLAFVLPAELLSTDYAAPIRAFLQRRFATTRVVTFRDRVFPGALVDAVLLMAEGEGPGGVEVVQFQNADELAHDVASTSGDGSGKWSRMLLPADSVMAYEMAIARPGMARLGAVLSVDIGVVTGANDFFVIDAKTRKKFKLERATQPVLPKGESLGSDFGLSDWRASAKRGDRAWLFMPKTDAGGAREYIAWGEEQGYNKSYKCRVRRVWWKLREFPAPDFFLGYMAHRAPRFSANSAQAGSTNLVHQVRAKEPLGIDRATLAAAFYNSVTLLSAELEGRTYGGGVLKLETNEAERILLPLGLGGPALNALSKRAYLVDAAARRGDFEAAADLVDPIVLGQGLGLNESDRGAVRRGWDSLRLRREDRGRSRP
jgi:adenine-specific DNA-methyltransferase